MFTTILNQEESKSSPPHSPLRLSFRSDVVLLDETERVTLRSAGGDFVINRPGNGVRRAVAAIAAGTDTEDSLAQAVVAADGIAGLAPFYAYLAQFDVFGMLRRSVVAEGRMVATISPCSPLYRFRFEAIDPAKKYVLSRFAYWRREGEHLVVESPRAHARLEIHDTAVASLLACFAKPTAPRNAVDQEALVLGLAAGADLLLADARCEEEGAPLAAWEFHDLLFHSRSRYGRHANASGATYSRRAMFDPLPVAKPALGGETVDLPRPDLERLVEGDPVFTQVLEERRTIKAYDEEDPITIGELGEFLYRAARVRGVAPPQPELGVPYETSSRVYPSGGASHELELYLTVRVCDGLEPGLYHYDALLHRLERISGATPSTDRLLRDASQATGGACTPQVLITLASRFQRLSWKYESIVYATTLKNVGVLLQTMYLVATAMGLAPCALGNGNSDLFAATAGTDYYAETSVGEFMLGSRRR